MGHMQGLASLHLDRILFRDLATANARYEAFSKKQADHRIDRGAKVNTKDVFYFLQNGKDPETGKGFTLHELVAEASLLILGGKNYVTIRNSPRTSLASSVFRSSEDWGFEKVPCLTSIYRHRHHIYSNRQHNILPASQSSLSHQTQRRGSHHFC